MTPIPDSAPLLSIAGAIATIRLNRPSCANRIEHGDLDVLLQHAKSIAANPDIRAVILTGTGKHFSSGYDLTSIFSPWKENPQPRPPATLSDPLSVPFKPFPRPSSSPLTAA